MTLASAYFMMDGTILLIAELTRVDAYFAQNAITAGAGKSMREGMMTMLATFQAKRNFRWAISLILFILEIVSWVLFIGVPWGFGESFGRPICEPDDADHWITPLFWRTTQGGWVSMARL
jgi:ABC-type multidrug transport system fused ATPase/permease subunit